MLQHENSKLLKYSSIAVFIVAIVLFIYLVNASKALSYLSKDPKVCINCHVMNTSYATWQHSSHARNVTCNRVSSGRAPWQCEEFNRHTK